VLVIVNFLFLFLGGILYLYAASKSMQVAPDDLFPTIALSETFSGVIGIIFILALISALFPSVDGAITSITSCYCIDILNLNQKQGTEKEKRKIRLRTHFSFAALFFLMTLLFKAINDKLIIDFILKFASITYGPLLGLFSFGILTRRQINDKLIWPVCIVVMVLVLSIDVSCSPEWYEKKLHVSLGLKGFSEALFGGYKIGNELILINGILTFAGLFMISAKQDQITEKIA
jgi:Na+/proline symporter